MPGRVAESDQLEKLLLVELVGCPMLIEEFVDVRV